MNQPQSLPPHLTLLAKWTCMEVKVVLKSPAPTKSKGKEPTVVKALESKPCHAPMAYHNPDCEVTEEPQHKHKATEMQLTVARAQLGHKTIMDEEQCQEQPKRARPKMCPPPAPEPTVDPAPAELEDRQVTTNERPKKKARLERVSA
ncbi:hypothetical protein RSOL_394410, partial [Rhizoctonia solani AG-3 Rhs1AP]